jgi:hypothetical protein
MPRFIVCLSTAVLAVCVCALSGNAQVSTASLNGSVLDSSGARVPGAKIVVTQTETNFSTETESGTDGSFRFPTIPVGPYVLTVTKERFSKYEQSGIVLDVGQVATLQVTLTVGSEAQQVTVTADAPQVDSANSTIQHVVSQQAILDIPLNGRNPATLMYTVPGVNDAALNPSETEPNSTVKTGANLSAEIAPTTNGVRAGGTYFSLDGADNVDPFNVIGGPFPNPDATQEFGVVTGSYGARYVSAPGGAVNIVTKSGTNQIHGSVFEFLRNGFFNARNDFSTTPDVLKRNQYGFAVGGPILKDKLFFFGSYQGTNIRSTSIINSNVGTAAEHNGMFVNTSTGATVTLPISTVAKNLLPYIPLPNSPNGFYRGSIPYRYDEPQWVTRIDYNLGQNRLFGRYFADHTKTPADNMQNNNLLTATQGDKQAWDSVALGDTWASKGGSWVVDARASYLRGQNVGLTSPSLDSLNLQALGATNVSVGNPPTLSTFLAGGLFFSGGSGQSRPLTSWDYSVDVQHVLSKHEIGFGTDVRLVGLKELNETGQDPAFLFFGIASRILYGNLNDNSYADFILGNPTVFFQQDGFYSNVHGTLFGLYAEDKYRATDRLTITYGLRWDPYLPFTIAHNQIDCWSPGQQSRVFTNAPLGLIYPGDPGCSVGGTSAKYAVVEPRVGLAYRLDKNGNTALRAGWGIYSTQFQLQSLIGFSAPPFVRSFFVTNPFQSVDNPWGSNGLSNPFGTGFQGPNYVPPSDATFPTQAGFNASAIDKNFQPGYVEQWTFSLQHAFSHSDSVELAYVGTQGIHIAQSYDANLPVYGPGASTSNERARRPYASEGLLAIRVLRSDATSNYNGLNVTFNHRAKGGLDLFSGFNWSKCLDDGSFPASTMATTENGDSPRLRRGLCDFDQNLTFRNTIVWHSPGLGSYGKLLRSVAGGWIWSALVTADAGQPFSVVDSADYSYTGNGLDLANIVPGQPTYLNGRLNYAAFTNNAPGTYGDSGRNSFRSPGLVDVDAALMKVFPIFERTQLMFRAEAFNLFNHPNFLAPGADYNGNPSTFGLITVARDPRILQFSLKLLF